jgi:hypothetical protein
MHAQSSLDLDPKLAHVQFFAGLADPVIAATAKAAMQCDRNVVMNLESATEQVLLIEARELEDLELHAANGDTAAAADLKRRASAGVKKSSKDTKPADSKPSSKPSAATSAGRVFNPDPNHPEGKCRLPGHDKPTGRGHMNKECTKGGSAHTPYAVVNVAAATPAVHAFPPYFASPYAATAAAVPECAAIISQAG